MPPSPGPLTIPPPSGAVGYGRSNALARGEPGRLGSRGRPGTRGGRPAARASWVAQRRWRSASAGAAGGTGVPVGPVPSPRRFGAASSPPDHIAPSAPAESTAASTAASRLDSKITLFGEITQRRLERLGERRRVVARGRRLRREASSLSADRDARRRQPARRWPRWARCRDRRAAASDARPLVAAAGSRTSKRRPTTGDAISSSCAPTTRSFEPAVDRDGRVAVDRDLAVQPNVTTTSTQPLESAVPVPAKCPLTLKVTVAQG